MLTELPSRAPAIFVQWTVSKLVLNIRGGRRGLLINSRDICSRAFRVQPQIGAQNGKRALARPVLVNEGCG